MGSLSDYAENALMGHFFGSAYTAAATVYLALCTADPTDAGTGASMNECANANGYARKAITFGAASSRRVTQSGAVTFDQASGAWGTVTHWAVVDSGTHGAGNMLAYGALAASKSIVANNTPSVASGEVYVELTASTGALLTAIANSFLDKMFRNQTYAQPATYVGLVTTTSSDSAAGTEVSGGSYARVLVNKAGGASPAWSAVSGGVSDNANAVTFTAASASWGTVVGTVLYDASSSGNALWYMNDTTDQAVGSGDTVSFAAGAIDVSQA